MITEIGDGQSTVLSNFNLIAGGESRVDALDALLSLSQSGLSRHLAHLPRDGLVFNNRQTQTIYNWLAGHEVRTIL